MGLVFQESDCSGLVNCFGLDSWPGNGMAIVRTQGSGDFKGWYKYMPRVPLSVMNYDPEIIAVSLSYCLD